MLLNAQDVEALHNQKEQLRKHLQDRAHDGCQIVV